MNLVSEPVFHLMLSIATGGAAAVWVIHDIIFLARLRRAPRGGTDALVGDQRFGYMMGIVIGTIGVIGTLRFNGVF
jgi:hypothetical protein